MATIFETVEDLGKIITDAITDGTEDNIPPRVIRNTLIRVSTGVYREVLPIIVPAECCVIGDELRSTRVEPRTPTNSTLTPKSDFAYSYNSLSRVADIVDDIVTGVTVTPTTGNTELQDQTWPYAESGNVGPQVQKLARGIHRQIDARLQTKQEAILPPAHDLADPNLGKGIDLNYLNLNFIQSEVIAYILDQYPGLQYSRTKCKQDIKYIIDALAYDISYGGTWQSVTAGLAYYNGREGVLQIDASEKAATLAAYDRLAELLRTISRDVEVTPVYQVEIAQVRGNGSLTTDIIDEVNNRITIIKNIIDNGPDTAPAIIYPDTSSATPAVRDAAESLRTSKEDIQVKTIDFINENFGSFRYNSSKCRRDLGYIITDTAFDVALGTNYNAVFTGMAYQRPNNAYNLNTQRTETIGSIRKARDLLKESVTTDGSSKIGSSNAGDRIDTAYNEIVDIIRNGTLGEVTPGDGVVNSLVFPNPAGVAQDKIDAKTNLIDNRTFIQEDVVAYVNNNYNTLVYNEEKCRRDAGYIVDALIYDILYGTNHASVRIARSYFDDGNVQVANQEIETIAAYEHLKSVAQDIILENTVTAQSGNSELQTKNASPASATESTEIATLMDITIDALTAGNLNSLPTISYPSITWSDAEYQTAYSDIESDKDTVIKETIQFISDTYNTFVYDHAKCSRDIGLIIDAARFDFMLGTNYASFVAGLSYLRDQSGKVVGDQKIATIAANEYSRSLALQNVNSNATAIAGVNNTWDIIDDHIHFGSGDGSNDAVDDQEVYNAIRMLELNKEFIVQEALASTDQRFQATVSSTKSGTNTIVIDDTSWLSLNMPITFEEFEDSTSSLENSGLQDTATYFVQEVISDTEFKVNETPGGFTSTLEDQESESMFIVKSSYTYNKDTCARDVREYIDSMINDLTYPSQWKRTYSVEGTSNSVVFYRPGAYATRLAARYYANSVIGSQEEDFYYLRNGTGLRLQTLDGLRGDLGAPNAYGTQRPTAGAYASLDPGWGPNDVRVWITARSPYVQNVSTFGYAATGQKIDGSLHNGGNDSIVSNDFTQVISDGIGAWITNNGRAELVSVFTYYSHVGYLAENGGRIRGTNGNNSYGAYGSVAEGVDPDETAVTGIVDNRTQYNATIGNVVTDSNQLLAIEFDHAGNEYTEAELRIFGPGDNEDLVADEFRDGAVVQGRIVESDPDNNPAGGEGYTLVSNTAQGGTTTEVTLSATDGNLSTAYPGMKVYITGGAAIGQFGIVDTYNAGTKVATVIKESDGTAGWDHVVPGTAIVAPNSTSTYQIEPRVEFSAQAPSRSTHTLATSAGYSDAAYFETSAQYTAVATTSESDGSGATFDVTRNGEKYYLTLNSGGIEYERLDTLTILGSSVGGVDSVNDITITATTINEGTGAIVQFDFSGIGQKGRFIVLPSGTGSTTGQSSIDGETWTDLTLPDPGASNVYANIAHGLVDDGSSTFKQSFAVAVGQGYTSAAYSTDGVTWNEGALPGTFATAGASVVAFGQITVNTGRFVAISANDSDVVYSDNGGQTWQSVASPLTGTNYTALTFGKGLFVALRNATTDTMYSEDGITWAGGASLPNAFWVDIAYGNNRFVALAQGTTGAYSLDGKNWTSITLPTIAGTYEKITYGQGVFVASHSGNQVAYSEDGINWTSYSTGLADGTSAIAFGNPLRDGKFVAVVGPVNAGLAVNLKIGARAKGRASVANEQIFAIRLTEPGSGYTTAPTITITDPNNIKDVEVDVRLGDGALANPTFVNRGSGFTTASGEIDATASNGFANFFQDGSFIAVSRLTERPVPGSNVVFDSLPGQYFKLVNTVSLRGTQDGSYTAFLQVSPAVTITEAPNDGDPVTMRIRFSQVRLTGHDFLDIGTGNFEDTNYPNTPVNNPDPDRETSDFNGGRVFYTATDQDGNFRVGGLFSVEQATGVATLNADAFNIAGLQELSLGEVTLGGNSASVSEFSTDPFFTANSDSVVPTQRAVKAYIEAQIGGGGATLNVNSVTAGDIFIGGNQITTVTGAPINIKANVNFTGTVLGLPLAYNYFLR